MAQNGLHQPWAPNRHLCIDLFTLACYQVVYRAPEYLGAHSNAVLYPDWVVFNFIKAKTTFKKTLLECGRRQENGVRNGVG